MGDLTNKAQTLNTYKGIAPVICEAVKDLNTALGLVRASDIENFTNPKISRRTLLDCQMLLADIENLNDTFKEIFELERQR
jgi:hypothetical protein